jgi:hypothetical protein
MGGEGVETLMEIFDWVRDLSVWVMHWANTPYGGLALFVLANSPMSFWYALICSLGSTLGGMLGYGIGRIGGRPLLERWVRAERIQLVERHYQRWDVWAVAVAGFTPIPYKVFTISAGAFLLDFLRFVIASILTVHLPLFQYPQHSFYSFVNLGILVHQSKFKTGDAEPLAQKEVCSPATTLGTGGQQAAKDDSSIPETANY